MCSIFTSITKSAKIPFIRKTRLDSLRICYHIKYARFGSSCIRITVGPREVYSKRLHISQAISIKKYIMSYTRQRILVTWFTSCKKSPMVYGSRINGGNTGCIEVTKWISTVLCSGSRDTYWIKLRQRCLIVVWRYIEFDFTYQRAISICYFYLIKHIAVSQPTSCTFIANGQMISHIGRTCKEGFRKFIPNISRGRWIISRSIGTAHWFQRSFPTNGITRFNTIIIVCIGLLYHHHWTAIWVLHLIKYQSVIQIVIQTRIDDMRNRIIRKTH